MGKFSYIRMIDYIQYINTIQHIMTDYLLHYSTSHTLFKEIHVLPEEISALNQIFQPNT
jgi:hypothetical protein